MEIRKTTLQDVDTALDVFAAAKRYMRANGNASQWGDEYPDRSIVTYDIACGSSYVMLENGEIVGTFALFLGEDESCRVIEDGAWHLDQPYGTIHRLASNGKARGVSTACAWLTRLRGCQPTRCCAFRLSRTSCAKTTTIFTPAARNSLSDKKNHKVAPPYFEYGGAIVVHNETEKFVVSRCSSDRHIDR